MKIIAKTRRLVIREFTLDDAPFMLEMLNTPGWLEFIGDRNVHSVEDAANYLKNGNLKSYAENGVGFYAVILKKTGAIIGTSGLIKRPFLEHLDVGFAFLPQFFCKGYALEASEAVMDFAKNYLHKTTILAFANKDNFSSIRLLGKLGVRPDKFFIYPDSGEELLLLSTDAPPDDKLEIDLLANLFFALFSNKKPKRPRLGLLKTICLKEAIFIKNTGGTAEIFNLKNFMASRQALLESGKLVDFTEKETSETTQIFGDIAQRFSFFEKSGALDGVFFEKNGAKSIQFIKKVGVWKISAVAWDEAE